MLIKNGLILSPDTGLQTRGDLQITDGIITRIETSGTLTPQPGEQVIDASSYVVAPGLVDIHVHFRDPGLTYKEDIHTGAMAAAAGGFTTVICMANTKPIADCPEVITDILTRAKKEPVRILQTGAVSVGMKGEALTDFEALAAAGACGFTDDGIPLTDEKLTEQAMRRAKALNLPLSFHEEDPAFIEKSGQTVQLRRSLRM